MNRAPLRVAVWDDGIGQGGINRVIDHLLPALARHMDALSWLLPLHRHAEARTRIPSVALLPLHDTFAPGLARPVARLLGRLSRLTAPRYSTFSRLLARRETVLRMRSAIKATGSTHLLVSALFTQPPADYGVPVAAIVYDTHYHPDWKDECLANLRAWAASRAILICISEATRREIERGLGAPVGNLVCIPIATAIPDGCPHVETSPHSLPRLLYPATLGAHKGHALLIESLLLLWNRGFRFELTLIGFGTETLRSSSPHPLAPVECARTLLRDAPPGFRDSIRTLGFRPDSELESLYQSADLVVLPSAFEGYGLPLGEAALRGKPVLCSDLPAFREQVSIYALDSAVTFVPLPTVAAWSTAIATRCQTLPLTPAPSPDLRPHALRWTWSHVAARYTEVISSARSSVRLPSTP